MKAHFKTRNGQLSFELEGADAKDLFKQISAVAELFDAEHECGLCHSQALTLRFRDNNPERYAYYELECGNCEARFQFGQRKIGGALFPRRSKNHKELPNGGWSKYEPQGDEDDEDAPPARPAPAPMQRKEEEQRKIVHISDLKTPGGLQPSFDRLGELVADIKATPTTLPGALAAMSDAFRKHGGEHGTQIFLKEVELYKANPDCGSTQAAKVMLKNLVDALGIIGGLAT